MWDSKRDTGIKNRFFDSVGEGEGGMIWENSTETCILPYVKKMTSPARCMKQGSQSWCTGTTQRDGMGDGGGRGCSGQGAHMYTCNWFMSMYGKNHHNIVK